MTQPEDALPKANVAADSATDQDFSLVRGGPFYRAQRALGLIRPDRWNPGRTVVVALVIAWVPLVLLTTLFHPRALMSLLRNYQVCARIVLAIPVLLIGQTLMESRFRMIARHVREANLLASDDLAYMSRVAARLVRWGDSWVPELVIIVLAYANTAAVWGDRVAEHLEWAVVGTGTSLHLTPAAWYYGLISQVIYRLLVGVCLWKWFLWTAYLFELSRRDLKLVATHPDHHGGIGFVGLSSMAFAPIAFAISAAIGSNWRYQILKAGAHLASFKLQGAVLLAVIIITAVGPLVFFVPRLAKLRRSGIMQYGILAQVHSTDFHHKWILHRDGRDEEFLATPEASTLADYGTSYENIEKMQPFPYDKGALLSLALAAVIPMTPVILAQIPLAVVLEDLLKAAR